MPSGRRPRALADPPAPGDGVRRKFSELCPVTAALAEVRRRFDAYATAPHDATARSASRPEWWRDRHERPVLAACAEVRSAVGDAVCRRFLGARVTRRQLDRVLVTAQTTRG